MGVHERHCCTEHGCKYGEVNCPVANGQTTQEGPCAVCVEMEGYDPTYDADCAQDRIDETFEIVALSPI